MQKTADIVIIGGGIIGVSIAYHLGRLGARNVLLLEKGLLCEGSTGLCAGGIRRQWTTAVNMQFALHAFDFFQTFRASFGVDPKFYPIGYLFLATDPKTCAAYEANVAFQNGYQVPSQMLARGEIERRWPFLNTADVLGGAFCDTDGYAGPHEVTHGLAKAARRLGVVIREHTAATAIDVRNGRVAGIVTPEGRVETAVVVNAAGPHAAEVGRLAGVEVPVEPIRRQLFITDPFDKLPPTVPLTIDNRRNFYFRREGKAVLLSGPQDETPSFNLTTDFDSMVTTAENATYRVPIFHETNIARGWGGLYEISPDNHAIIGPAPGVDGFFLANGFSGHGFQHGPGAGLAVAELILRGRCETFDIEPLSPARFRTGKLVRESLTAFKH